MDPGFRRAEGPTGKFLSWATMITEIIFNGKCGGQAGKFKAVKTSSFRDRVSLAADESVTLKKDDQSID